MGSPLSWWAAPRAAVGRGRRAGLAVSWFDDNASIVAHVVAQGRGAVAGRGKGGNMGTAEWSAVRDEGVGRLHPDRSFETIACAGAAVRVDDLEGFCATLARLELGEHCTLLCGSQARRVVALLDEAAAGRRPGWEVRATLCLDGSGRVRVEPLRAWLAGGREGAGSLRAVRNGAAGPYACRPLQMGADVVVEDLRQMVDPGLLLCAGVPAGPCLALVARSDRAWRAFWESAAAAGCSEEEARAGAAGLDVRPLAHALVNLPAAFQRRSDAALAVAHFLAAHPDVAWVSYPGLPGDSANDAARRTLEHGFGPLVGFGLARGRAPFGEGLDESPAEVGCTASRLVAFGGVDAGVFALSAGLESPLDVVGALARFLDGESAPDR